MKPVRLTLQAFGPYSGREVIDFRPAVESGLFGIYGQTGSGKSTIFSAMTFALFGEPAKTEQEAVSLRSDHADPSLCTEVEFVFDIGRKRYVILRRPEQMRAKQRGEGETKSPHEAHLFDATGISFERLTDADRGRIIAEKKVRDVDSAVVERLGYGKEQFRQIVLLPQGRFETFLAAKTKERMGILRDLFDVSLFQTFAADLKAQADVAERAYRSDREFCDRILSDEGLTDFAALTDAINVTMVEYDNRVQVEASAKSHHEQAATALQNAKAVLAEHLAAETAAAEFGKLDDQRPEFIELSKRLAFLEAVRGLRDLDNALSDAKTDVDNRLQQNQRAQASLETAKRNAGQAEDDWSGQSARRAALDAAKATLSTYLQHKDNLAKATAAETDVATTTAALTRQNETVRNGEQALAAVEQAIHASTDKLTRAREEAQLRQTLTFELTALKSALKDAQTYAAMLDLRDKARELEGKRQTQTDAALAEFEHANDLYQKAEQNLTDAQAMHLAMKLENGEPCPVCGSHTHPAPATGAPATAGLDQSFRDARKAKEDRANALRQAELELARATASRQERDQQAEDLAVPAQNADALSREIANTEARIGTLGPVMDPSDIQLGIDDLNQERTSDHQKLDKDRQEYAQVAKNLAVAESRVQELLDAVPEGFRSADILAAKTEEQLRDIRHREAEIAAIETNRAKAREDLIAAQSECRSAQDHLTAAENRRDKTLATFETRLSEAGLTAGSFGKLKPEIDNIPATRARIDEFNQRYSIAKDRMDTTARAIVDRPKPDLDTFTESLAHARQALDDATTVRHDLNARMTHLQSLQNRIAEIEKKLAEEEERTGPLRKLAALVNGDNDQKLELETFAIGAMFDQVLTAANQRLEPMTNGRFRLERSLEESGRGRRGLGIQAFDMFTGKSRPTASLSGGETFIAALALALGLADVVEAASGKVRLDTIFIDEGFGSLDTENGTGTLDQVLQVLNTLVSQNRSVGIISHVPLVQEVIPNGFYIRKGSDGSYVEDRHGF